MSKRFEGRTVAITGVGRVGQVGDQLAQAFAREGAALVLLGRAADEVGERAEAARALGVDVMDMGVDLTRVDSVQSAAGLAAEFSASRGGLHAFVHAAGGFGMTGIVAETERGRWDDMLAINLTTAFVTARAFVPLLRATRGASVFFASAAALPGGKVAKMSAYAAAKGGVITLMRAIAQEEASSGVRANAVAPTSIRTPENEKAMGKDVRYVEPAELAETILFLCSDGARAISGQIIALG